MEETCPVCQSPVEATDRQCKVCGFKLEGSTKSFNLHITDMEDLPQETESGKACLRTIRGPRIGVEYGLNDSEMTLGRNPNCSIFLNDMTVSRENAVITFENGCHVIRDLRSYNGLWVNNKNVNAKALKSGDIIQIGAFAFVYEA